MRRRVVAPPPSDFRGRHDKQVPNGIRQAHTIETPPDIRKLVRQMQFRAHRLAGSALSKRLPVTAFSAVVGRSALAGFRPPSRLPRVLLGWSPYKNNHYGARLLASASSASDMSPTAPRSLSQQLKGHGRVVYKSAESVQLAAAKKVIVVGKLDEVRAAAANMNGASEALLEDLKPDSSTSAVAKIETLFDPVSKQRLMCVCVPETHSRNTARSRPDLVKKALFGNVAGSSILVASRDADDAVAVALALAKCYPAYSLKSAKQSKDDGNAALEDVSVAFAAEIDKDSLSSLQHIADSIRASQVMVDAPPCHLDCDAFEEFVRDQVSDISGVAITVLKGEELKNMGMGGFYGVGQAAATPPRLIVLSHDSDAMRKSVCLAGKGIIFDTGGLSIKVPPNQQGMKVDMAGAAAQLGAFVALARMGGIGQPLHCVLCIAENAVSEHALRNDDVITMYSGLTVEINNTDAEGRLVLGDGVAYCAKHLNPDLVIDMATLTGAQGITTGILHGALYCNDPATEAAAVAAGISSGDYAYPILYAPELHLPEFKSQVADLKNSVKNRVNAQCSCAGSFILEHLFNCGYTGRALHIDMAFPAVSDERGTAYGVGLICKLLKGI